MRTKIFFYLVAAIAITVASIAPEPGMVFWFWSVFLAYIVALVLVIASENVRWLKVIKNMTWLVLVFFAGGLAMCIMGMKNQVPLTEFFPWHAFAAAIMMLAFNVFLMIYLRYDNVDDEEEAKKVATARN